MPLTAGERYAVATAKAKAAPKYSVPKVNARIQGASMAQHQRGGQLTVAPRDQYQHGHATITGATEATHQNGGYGAALPATTAHTKSGPVTIASAYTGVRPGSTSGSHPAHTPAHAGAPKSQPHSGPTPTPKGSSIGSGLPKSKGHSDLGPLPMPKPTSGPTPTNSPAPGGDYTAAGVSGMKLLEFGAIAAVAVLLLIYMRKERRR